MLGGHFKGHIRQHIRKPFERKTENEANTFSKAEMRDFVVTCKRKKKWEEGREKQKWGGGGETSYKRERGRRGEKQRKLRLAFYFPQDQLHSILLP